MSITIPSALDDRSRKLLHDAAEAGPARREQLQNEVVELNLSMARRLARRYRNRGVAEDDLEQVARLGLVKSVRRFDPDRRSFDAYAVPTVLGELRRYFRDSAWTVRPSRQVQDLQSAASAARETLRDGTSHEPTNHEVAQEIGATDAELRHAESVQGAFTPRSLDTPNPVSGEPTGDLIGDDDPGMAAVDRLQAVAPSVRSLDPRRPAAAAHAVRRGAHAAGHRARTGGVTDAGVTSAQRRHRSHPRRDGARRRRAGPSRLSGASPGAGRGTPRACRTSTFP
ncbi:MAG: sigma-70 family RNA polymerase sigma factor [Aeromicrobium erythreum]